MADRIKVVRTDQELECPHLDDALRDRGVELVLLPDGTSEDELVRETRNASLILMCYTPITARVIDEAKALKGIVKYGVGIDAIDIEAAKARKIPVVNVPEYAEETVAEGAFALLIALAKKLRPLQKAMDETGWVWPTSQWQGSDISGKTLGPGALVIHAARGAIVDEAALIEALRSGQIGGAGLDVFSQEPLALSGHPLSPLFKMDNVILTPHFTFFTHEAMQRLEEDTLARCDEILQGKPVLVKSTDPRLRGQKNGVSFP